jgi:hypothetical protein
MGGRSAAVAEVPPRPAADGSRRIYVLWGVGLGLLAALALVCWLVVGPALATRRVVMLCAEKKITEEEAVNRLGGPEQAPGRVLAYLHYFNRFFGNAHDLRAGTRLAACCEPPPRAAPSRDQEIMEAFVLLCMDSSEAVHRAGRVKWAREQRANAGPLDRAALREAEAELARLNAVLERHERWLKWFSRGSREPDS